MSKRKLTTTNHKMRSEDELIADLDAKELIRTLSRRGKLAEVTASFAKLKPKSAKSWQTAFKKLTPLAGGMLSHLAVHGDSDTVRLNASVHILNFGGHKPVEKLEHTGKDGEPLQAAVMIYKIPDNGRDPEMVPPTPAKKKATR